MSAAIDVPQYVADEFNRPFRHPGQNPGAMERSVGRVFRLIGEALDGIQGLGMERLITLLNVWSHMVFNRLKASSSSMLSSVGKEPHWPYSMITNLPLTILFGLFRVGLEKLIGNCFLRWCRES